MNIKSFRLGRIFGCLVCLVFLAGNLQAQKSDAGSISGRVMDQSGAVVPGADVVVTDATTAFSQAAVSDDIGLYHFSALRVGTYSVSASLVGFQTVKQDNIAVSAGAQVSLDFTLSPGQISETVEVTSTTQRLQTQENTVKGKIFLDQVQNLPLNSRSLFELGLLNPSVYTSFQQSGAAMQYNMNGQNAMGYYLMHDGVEAGIGGDGQYYAGNNFFMSVMSVDAIQEYDVATSNYSADIKGSSGYVNIVSRTGTNDFHGTGFYFVRNSSMGARNFFAADKGDFTLNNFGGTVTGPIKQDKVFFLVSYETQQISDNEPKFSQVPTQFLRNRMDPAYLQHVKNTPLPNEAIPGNPDVGNLRRNEPIDHSQHMVTGRVDINFSETSRVFVQYTFNHGERIGGSLFGGDAYELSQPERHQTAALGWTKTFSPHLVNNLKLGLNRFLQGRVRGVTDPADALLPGVSIPGVTLFQPRNLKKLGNTQPQLSNKTTWVKGRHTISFGGGYVFLLSGQNQFNPLGITFPSIDAFVANRGTALGATFGEDGTQNGEHLSYHQRALYIQDDIRVTPTFTLNLGLRYDTFGVFSDSHGNAVNVINGPFDPVRPPGAPLYKNNHDFGPRIGFAWRPSTDRSMVIRGGFGQFFGKRISGQMGDVLALNSVSPFRINESDFSPISYPFSPELLATGRNTSLGRFSFDPNSKDYYTLQWNLTGEIQIGEATTWSLGYVGNRGVHVPRTARPNAFDARIGQRPNLDFNFVAHVENTDNTHYHGLQTSLRRRFTDKLAYDLHYAWAHSTGTSTGFLEISAAVGFDDNQVQTHYNTSLSRGNLPNDIRHNFSSSFVYDLPYLSNADPFVQHVLGGWKMSGIVRINSGLPFNIRTGMDAGDNTFQQVPDTVPGASFMLSGVSPADGIVNRAAFTTPTKLNTDLNLFLGNYGNNSLRMPTAFAADWMLGKRIYSAEDWNIDFRAEFFNVFNHPIFSPPRDGRRGTNLLSPNFGKSTAASQGRQIQFSFRFSF